MAKKTFKTSRRRRHYGQHFLTNPAITDQIVQHAEVSSADTVIEVGPGRGILTDSLLKTGCHVLAIEKDAALFPDLQTKYQDEARLKLCQQDALEFVPTFSKSTRAKLVANLPYSVGTEIIFRFLEYREQFALFCVMVQKEVADRLVSKPGSKNYGILSVLMQLFCESRIVMKVAPGSFSPPPKVDSAVVLMRVQAEPRVAIDDVEAFKQLVRCAFSARRKMLKNNLASIYPLDWDGELQSLGLDPKIRAEELSLQQFAQLFACTQTR